MIFESAGQKLETVRVSLKGETNDIYICRDLRSSANSLYTVLSVHDHSIVKKLLELFKDAGKDKSEGIIDTFTFEGNLMLVFPYRQERPLENFYMGDAYSLTRCEDIAMNVLVACIGTHLPWQILHLILSQRKVNIDVDDEIFFGYEIDLKGFDPDAGEGVCVYEAASIIREILSPQSSDKTISYQLITKKIQNESYSKFSELYRDIRIAAVPKKKRGIKAKIKNLFLRNKDRIFAVLLVISIILLVLAVLSLISQILFGDVLWLSFLYNHFKIIGTENLSK
ncbi:MAG: hypothetical protein K6E56_01825 [Lachnospiraceae bacterium]|nr:hypothetical protein [Lachnospiraceae bacterium]